eukprot:gene21982-24921_t
MSRDWMSGLKFILTDATNEDICEIRFTSSVFERLPISFKVKIFPQAIEAEEIPLFHNKKPQRVGIFTNLTHCFTDNSCLETSEEQGGKSPTPFQSQYAPLDEVRAASDTVYLQTR